MSETISLIVGLGNPGTQYRLTRHNAGYWFVEAVANYYQVNWKQDNKSNGRLAALTIAEKKCYLFIPNTWMNNSGLPIQAFSRYHRINVESILIAHDELDLMPGTVRLKKGKGIAGHKGLKDIVMHLNSNGFYRFRIGIGHPGYRHKVHDYVLSKPSVHERTLIQRAIDLAIDSLPVLIQGDTDQIMQQLNSR